MKPEWITDEVVRLAKRLHDVGYRQEIQEGNWVECDGYVGVYLVCSTYSKWVVLHELGDVPLEDCIPIPTLSQCLRWLEEKIGAVELNGGGGDWTLTYGWDEETGKKIFEQATTPEKAAMLAMIKILEGENE